MLQIILEDAEAQESLCYLGGIPIISSFAQKKFASEIRKEAAAFVRQMYQTSSLTLQMFICCGGMNVLAEFLEEDIDDERDLVLIGVNGVWNVFGFQVTPKSIFGMCCHLHDCRDLRRRTTSVGFSLAVPCCIHCHKYLIVC